MGHSRRLWISVGLIILILILTGAGILVLMKTGKESTAKIQEPPRRVAVVLQEIVPRPFTKTAEAYATVSPLKKGTVSARISGPVDQISADAEPGRSVSKGEVLGRIEETRYKIALEKAEASLNKFKALLKIERSENEKRAALFNIAKQRFELAKSDYGRKKVLEEGKLIAKQELEIAESQLELRRSELENARSELRKRESRIQSVQADIASAKAEIKRLKEDLSDTFIRAPFDGARNPSRSSMRRATCWFTTLSSATRIRTFRFRSSAMVYRVMIDDGRTSGAMLCLPTTVARQLYRCERLMGLVR